MSHKTLSLFFILVCAGLVSITQPVWSRGFYSLPPMAPPEEYGNVLINRVAAQKNELPVIFSHWSHRQKYTCEVCHNELEFNMKVNTTEMTHKKMKKGRHCGACHNGKTAFGHQDTCLSCHNDDSSNIRGKFIVFSNKPFPTTEFGNGIDWVQALQRGLVSPRRYLKEETFDMAFEREVELVAEMGRIPPAYFPHKPHLEWMSCDMCHPTVFNIKKKGTKHFRMNAILKGQFCGVCHLNVAFPIDDCNRCHPGVSPY